MDISQLRYKSLIFDNLKSEDTEFLNEVLEAEKEKHQTEESKLNKLAGWIREKLCCKSNAENEDSIQEEKEKDEERREQALIGSLEKLEEAHIEFSKKFGAEKKTSSHEKLVKEVTEDVQEKITDLKENIMGEKRSALPVWDQPNKEGNTALHLSISLAKPEATSLLLKYGADTNVRDSKGQTPLHVACNKGEIEEATKLVSQKAKMIPDKQNQTPAIENLLHSTQSADKVRNLMTEVYKSKDKLKFFQKLFNRVCHKKLTLR